MLVGIVVLSVLLYPAVLGQSVDFEQECHVLRTLEILEARLQEQDARLKIQEKLLEEQKTQVEQQKAVLVEQESRLEHQAALLIYQNTSLAGLKTQLEEQNVSLAGQRIQLEQQQAHVRELEAKLNASVQSTQDPNVGFTVYNPKDTNITGRITFTHILTNSGDGFDITTGEFTCSIAGYYAFSLTVTLYKTAYYAQCGIIKDTQWLGGIYVNPSPAQGYFPASVTVYTHLQPGNKVYLGNCSPASSMDLSSSSYFTGYLMYIVWSLVRRQVSRRLTRLQTMCNVLKCSKIV